MSSDEVNTALQNLSEIKQGGNPLSDKSQTALQVAEAEADRLFEEYDEVSDALDRDCLHVIVARWDGKNGVCKYNVRPSGKKEFNKRLTGITNSRGHHLVGVNKKIFEQGNDDGFIDTLRHEVAHAVVYEIHNESQGHNHNWKAMASKLGADPSSSHNKRDRSNEYKYYIGCPNCGMTSGKTKRSKTIKKPFYRKCGVCDHSPLSSFDSGNDMPDESGVVAVDSIPWDNRNEWREHNV